MNQRSIQMPSSADVFLSGYIHGGRGFLCRYYFLSFQNSLQIIGSKAPRSCQSDPGDIPASTSSEQRQYRNLTVFCSIKSMQYRLGKDKELNRTKLFSAIWPSSDLTDASFTLLYLLWSQQKWFSFTKNSACI